MTRRILLPALTVALLAGCGIAAEGAPRGADPPPGPFPALASPTPAAPFIAASGAVAEQLYFVKDGKLVAVTRHVDTMPTVDELITALQTGPTDAERDTGLSSALLRSDVASLIIDDGQAVVALASPIDGTGRSDEALAYAQLVCTLTARTEISGVSFTRDGQSLAVPRGDGSLSPGPLTAADYATLVIG